MSPVGSQGRGAALAISDAAAAQERARAVQLHESIAALMASQEDYEAAYWHLRSALELQRAFVTPARIPEQEQLQLEVEQLRREHAKAKEQSLRDSLTSSYNRRYLDQWLIDLMSRRGVSTAGTAVALADLDWFKRVNDTYGHHSGDRVLQTVADLLQQELPPGGFCARYGGEEFVLVMPEVDARSAVRICEATRCRIERHDWSRTAPGLRVTVSIGVHHQRPGECSGEPPLLCADRLLYTAKRSGRNVVAYTDGGVIRLTGVERRRDATQPALFRY